MKHQLIEDKGTRNRLRHQAIVDLERERQAADRKARKAARDRKASEAARTKTAAPVTVRQADGTARVDHPAPTTLETGTKPRRRRRPSSPRLPDSWKLNADQRLREAQAASRAAIIEQRRRQIAYLANAEQLDPNANTGRPAALETGPNA